MVSLHIRTLTTQQIKIARTRRQIVISHQVLVGVGAGDDFTQDTDLKPFESFFGVKAEDHNDIRDNGVFHVMTGSITGGIPNCGAALTAKIQSGKHHLWVEGSCEIKQSEYNDLVNATSSTNGVTVLIHDGLFLRYGTSKRGCDIKQV
ncbi:hypothetical protein [Vibrio harveyi]|uniref:hypothetical protein n=1 Tax=Vibrio harveyi TaxID=669 RepID=UPI00217DF5C6|nr:hypothetical protein [Vibrio harveyi]